ncbi:MAG: winged helix-turn-helix domain-containing protein, partial [Burkholderiaceae bacterium]|nr:winged helix-turn-helix domain-containing protein [Burkholderiaceae bacterium]
MAPRLSIRIDYPGGRLGPGKVELLEHIARHGSIAAAARAMDMSYKRAWELVDTLNHMFREPVVSSQPGRNTAGATAITPFGRQVVAQYRAAEGRAAGAVAAALAELSAAARPGPRRAP